MCERERQTDRQTETDRQRAHSWEEGWGRPPPETVLSGRNLLPPPPPRERRREPLETHAYLLKYLVLCLRRECLRSDAQPF